MSGEVLCVVDDLAPAIGPLPLGSTAAALGDLGLRPRRRRFAVDVIGTVLEGFCPWCSAHLVRCLGCAVCRPLKGTWARCVPCGAHLQGSA